MKWRSLVTVVIIPLMFMKAYGISKYIAGRPIPIGNIVKRIQYDRLGAPFKNFEEAPFAVSFSEIDKSLKVSWPEKHSPDSLYYQFIPGDQVVLRISAEVEWIDSLKLYTYAYTLFSDPSSICSIWHIEVEWWNFYKAVISPSKWLPGSLPYPPRKMHYWGALQESNYVLPGLSLSGFGFQSVAPPVIASFEVWGRAKEIELKGLQLLNESDAEEFAELYSDISSEHTGIKGFLIIPGVCPEVIDPVEWCLHIDAGLSRLREPGYIDEPNIKNIHQIFLPMIAQLKKSETQNLNKLSQEISTTLAALAPYQDQMEPEAWAFITENLKYVLRHLDIVQFKEYP
jgi:hypothetical protein